MAKIHKNVNQLDALLGESEDMTGYLGFPPYEQNMFQPPYTVEVQLLTEKDQTEFTKLIGHTLPIGVGERSATSIWFPALENGERGSNNLYCWVEVEDAV